MVRSVVVSSLLVLAMSSSALAQGCVGAPVSVQVLGSNGPALNGNRASASYLLWIGSQAKVLVDMGSGAHLRLPSRRPSSPTCRWSRSAIFIPTTRPISRAPLVEPSVAERDAAHRRALRQRRGAEFLRISRSPVRSERGRVSGSRSGHERPARHSRCGSSRCRRGRRNERRTDEVFEGEGMTVTAFGIPHGNLPTLAYRVETRGMSGGVQFRSERDQPEIRRLREGRECPDHASRDQCREQSAARVAGGRRPGRPKCRCRAVDRQPSRPVRSRSGDRRSSKAAYTGALTIGADLQCTPVQ